MGRGCVRTLNRDRQKCHAKIENRRKILYLEEFHTLLNEVEAIVNSRPLTYVSEERMFLVCFSYLIHQYPIMDEDSDEDWLPKDANSYEVL